MVMGKNQKLDAATTPAYIQAIQPEQQCRGPKQELQYRTQTTQ